MSKIKYDGLHQYGAEPFKQQQFGPAGVEWVKLLNRSCDVIELKRDICRESGSPKYQLCVSSSLAM